MNRPRIYLAGPEVFLPDAARIGEAKRALCERHGATGLFPLDNEPGTPPDGTSIDALIYRGNVAMMREADAGIFNLSPFRGPGADNGTSFELGFMTALGKRCAGYANDPGDYVDRVRERMPIRYDAPGDRWLDDEDMSVEDFGRLDNLMLDNALRDGGVPPSRRLDRAGLGDLVAFEGCLRQLMTVLTR